MAAPSAESMVHSVLSWQVEEPVEPVVLVRLELRTPVVVAVVPVEPTTVPMVVPV